MANRFNIQLPQLDQPDLSTEYTSTSDALAPGESGIKTQEPTAPIKTIESAPEPTTKPVAERVNIIDRNGKVFSIPIEEVPNALKYDYKIESPDEASIRQYLKENKGLSGDAKAAISTFIPEMFSGLVKPSYDSPLDQAKAEALAKDHEVSNVLGGIAGFGLSLFSPVMKVIGKGGSLAEKAIIGTVGEKLAANALTEAGSIAARKAAPSLLRTMAASTAKMGTEGALFSTPKAIDEASLGDYKLAGETLLFGFGAGAALGAAGSLIGKGASLTKEATISKLTPEAIESFKNKNAFESLFLNGKPSVKNIEEAKAAARLTELKVATPDELKEILSNLKRKEGESPLDHIDRINKELKKSISKESTEGTVEAMGKEIMARDLLKKQGELDLSHLERLGAEKKAMGETIGGYYKEMDGFPEASTVFHIGDLTAELRSKVLNPLETGITAIGNETLAKKVGGFIESLDNKFPLSQDFLSFEDLHKIRQHIDDKAKWRLGLDSETESFNKSLKQMRGIIQDELDVRGKIITKANGREDLFKKFAEANQSFRLLNKAEDFLENAINKEEAAGNSLNFSDILKGGGIGGAVGGIAGLATGHVWPALLGIVGPYINKYLRTNGARLKALATDKFGILLTEQANKLAGVSLESLPAFLKGESTKAAIETAPVNVMMHFLGKKDKGEMNKQEQFTELSDKLAKAISDPESTAQGISNISTHLANTGAPNVASEYVRANTRAIRYIYNEMPKPNEKDIPFTSKKWEPSKQQLTEYENKLKIVQNPFIVINKLQNLTLTSADVAAFKAVYPALYEQFKTEIAKVAADPSLKLELPYSVRQKIAMLTGVNLDPQNLNVQAYQASFAPKEEKGSKSKFQIPSIGTDTQRIANK